MFTEEPYQNAFKWIELMQSWMNSYLAKNQNTVTNKDDLYNMIDMCEKLFMVSTNAKEEDSKKLTPTVTKLSQTIIKSKVKMDEDLQDRIYDLMDFIMLKIDSSLQGVDPTEMLAMSDAKYKSSPSYNLQNEKVNPQKEMKLDPANPDQTHFDANSTYNIDGHHGEGNGSEFMGNGTFADGNFTGGNETEGYANYTDGYWDGNYTDSNATEWEYEPISGSAPIPSTENPPDFDKTKEANRLLAFKSFNKRLLLEKKKKMTASKSLKKTYNKDSASVIIPQDASNKLNPATVTFVQTKDPKSIQSKDSVKIVSFVVNIRAGDKVTRTQKKYPEDVNPMIVRIPWAKPPLLTKNYVNNCDVQIFDESGWKKGYKYCKISKKSDSKAAMITCSEFGTYGISCSPGSAKREVAKKNINGNYLSLSIWYYFFMVIFGIILF